MNFFITTMPTDDSAPGFTNQTSLNAILNLPNQALRALVSRPWILAYILLIQATFQGLIIAHWGLVGNILTLIVCGLFLVLVYLQTRQPGELATVIFGTRTQQLAALFVFSLVITMLWGNHSLPAFLSLGQKITFLLVMAIVIEAMRRKNTRSPLAWIISGTVALLFLLILIDYYFGIDLTFLREKWHVARDYCKGINHRRMVHLSIDNVYGTNRLAFYSLFPVALGMGLIFTSTRLLARLVAASLVILIIFGVVLSGSRSGTLAILITLLSFILINIRSGKNVIRYIIANSVILGSVFLLLWILPVGVTSLERMFENDSLSRLLSGHVLIIDLCGKDSQTKVGKSTTSGNPGAIKNVRSNYKKGIVIDKNRIRNWKIAIDVFLENPIGGSGFRTSTEEALARVPDTRITDPHSGYLTVLSEAGLLGTLPMVALLFYSMVLLFRPVPGMSDETIIWKTAFLSAFAGMLAANLTASYLFERHLWVVLAFAAVIEIWKRENSERHQTDQTDKTA